MKTHRIGALIRKTIRAGALILAAAGMCLAPPAHARCGGDTQPVGHFLEGFVSGCQDGGPVQAFIYLLGSGQAETNSDAQNIACEDSAGTNQIGQPCQLRAGAAGDGRVTVLEDWGIANVTIAGCPNPFRGPDGSNPIGVHVVCNDGRSVVVTSGFATFLSGYLLEAAHPAAPSGAQEEIPAAGGPAPQVVSASGDHYVFHLLDLDDPSDGPALTHAMRGYWSDCDAGAAGLGLTCDPSLPGRVPDVSRGKVYIKDAPCESFGDIQLSSGWVVPPNNLPGANAPDANGDVHLQIAQPTTGCRYVGATQTIAAFETLAVAGVIALPSGPVDAFQIDAAEFVKSRLTVTFSTINESRLVGFNLYAGSVKLNAAPLDAVRSGSHTYLFKTSRSALKGSKTIVLEGEFIDGTSQSTPPFPLK